MADNLNSIAKILLLILSVDCGLSATLNTSNSAEPAIASTTSSLDTNNNCTVLRRSAHLKETVEFIYRNNYDNFNQVLRFSDTSSDPNFQADVLIVLFNVMSDAHQVYDPFPALQLYRIIEVFLSINQWSLEQEQLTELNAINNFLLWQPIRERGADILTSAVLSNSYNFTLFQSWCDDLHASSARVWQFVISTMVNRVRWTLPNEELVSRLSNFSEYLRFNIEAMLVLYEEIEEVQFRGIDQMEYLAKLYELKQHRDYLKVADLSAQSRVERCFPAKITELYDGKICLSQQMANESTFYLQKCEFTDRQCIYINTNSPGKRVFSTAMTGNLTGFRFRSVWSNLRPIYLKDGEAAQPGGFTLNVFSPAVFTGYQLDWKIHLDDGYLVIQSMNRTLTLCAGNSLAATQGERAEWYTYTRNSSFYDAYKEECRWNVENCKGVV